MDKGFYIHAGSKTKFGGVESKIRDQITVFSRSFSISEVVLEKEMTNLIKSFSWRLPGASWGRKYNEALDEISKSYESGKVFFYIRYQAADCRYIRFISELRSRYPTSRIILEIPTYPYYMELLQSRSMWPWFFKDRFHRRELRKYVDRIVTFSSDDVIHGIPTIRTINGIDVSRVSPVKSERNDESNNIRLLAVAQFQPSHGYERVIKGIERYYACGGKRNIELHMVGEGSESKKYRRIVAKSDVSDHVIFHGSMKGQELSKIYDNMDIGLGGFGLYKRRIKTSSSLKVREYLAKGLPVSCGAPNDAFFTGGKQYQFEYPNDKSVIDLNEMLDWYDRLVSEYGGRNKLACDIRRFAEKTVDIFETMGPVIDYLNGDKDE